MFVSLEDEGLRDEERERERRRRRRRRSKTTLSQIVRENPSWDMK